MCQLWNLSSIYREKRTIVSHDCFSFCVDPKESHDCFYQQCIGPNESNVRNESHVAFFRHQRVGNMKISVISVLWEVCGQILSLEGVSFFLKRMNII